MLSFIYIFSLQQQSCIMVAMVLLRCYQYHRCYDHIWAANCKAFQGHLCLEGDLYYIFILQTLQICPWTKYKHINNDLSFSLQGDLYYIFILQSLQICPSTKYKHINNDHSFIPSRWPLLYIILQSLQICPCIKYKHINNDPSSFKAIFTMYLFYNLFTLVQCILSTKTLAITFFYLQV